MVQRSEIQTAGTSRALNSAGALAGLARPSLPIPLAPPLQPAVTSATTHLLPLLPAPAKIINKSITYSLFHDCHRGDFPPDALELVKARWCQNCVHLVARKPRPSADVRCAGHPRLRGRAEYLRLGAAGLHRTPAAQRRKEAGKEESSLASSHGSNKKVWALPSDATCLCLRLCHQK